MFGVRHVAFSGFPVRGTGKNEKLSKAPAPEVYVVVQGSYTPPVPAAGGSSSSEERFAEQSSGVRVVLQGLTRMEPRDDLKDSGFSK